MAVCKKKKVYESARYFQPEPFSSILGLQSEAMIAVWPLPSVQICGPFGWRILDFCGKS